MSDRPEERRWTIYCAEGPPDDERVNGPFTDGWVEVVEASALEESDRQWRFELERYKAGRARSRALEGALREARTALAMYVSMHALDEGRKALMSIGAALSAEAEAQDRYSGDDRS